MLTKVNTEQQTLEPPAAGQATGSSAHMRLDELQITDKDSNSAADADVVSKDFSLQTRGASFWFLGRAWLKCNKAQLHMSPADRPVGKNIIFYLEWNFEKKKLL